jgi:nucleoside-diphosphate-sugar epimerase/CBS domain-containing protein
MKYPVARVESRTSIQEAIRTVERSPFDRAFVVDPAGVYLGCVTIADLRRLLISGARGEEPVEAYPPRHVHKLTAELLEGRELDERMMSGMELEGVRYLPVVDAEGKIADVVSLEELEWRYGLRPAAVGDGPGRRVLVVGGAGYLGSVLARKLLSRGFRVRILDSFIYGHRSLQPLAEDRGLEIVEGDLRHIPTMVATLADVDAVVLLAAIVGDPASKVRPIETFETNVLAAQALASAARLQQVGRFLYASTCSVYGVGSALLDEEAPLNPVSLYARSKIETEKIILGMGGEYFSPTILRMGTLYGLSPRMRFDLVVNTMSMKSFVDGRIQVFGGGQWRPLLGVEDAAEVYARCLEADLGKVGNQVFNVGSDAQNYRIEEVAGIISTALGGIPIHRDHSNLDARDYRVSFAKLSETLGFRPGQTIADAARAIVASLRSGDIRNPAQRIYYNHFFDSTEE